MHLPAAPRLPTNPSDVSIAACGAKPDSPDARSPFVGQYRLLAGHFHGAKSVVQLIPDHLIWYGYLDI